MLQQVAKNASAAAEGLCTWVQAMKAYHEASKIVKPKLEALAVAEGQMDAANKVYLSLEIVMGACHAVDGPSLILSASFGRPHRYASTP